MRGGIDFGGTKVQAVVVDDDGTVRGQGRLATPTSGGPDDAVTVMADALRDAAHDADVHVRELDGLGVGTPGKVDDAAGTVTDPPNNAGWNGSFDLRRALQGALGVDRIALGNDVDAGTLAEYELGAGQAYDDMLGVFWGTGVGGGLVLGGELWRGRGAAGEIGHVVVVQDGDLCGCGRRGCMEAYAGRGRMEARAREAVENGEPTVLFDLMRERERTRLTSGVWRRALRDGDTLAVRIVDRAIAALGTGIASAVNLLDVEAVVIGGGLGDKLGEPYIERIRDAMRPHLFRDEEPPAVVGVTLGDLGGAMGAALLARDAATSARRA